MQLKKYLLSICLVFVSSALFAHAVWMETSPAGKKGVPQQVKIFFGEFSTKDVSPAAKWFSDLKDFTIVLIKPGKKEIKLTTAAATDHYLSTFTPEENGLYTIVVHHIVKDVYNGMKLDYNSSATVRVGEVNTADSSSFNNNIVSLVADGAYTAKKDNPLLLKVFYDAKPVVHQEFSVVAPNGWEKGLYSNEKGQASFTPLWAGTYLAEYTYTEKIPGEHNGKKYETVKKIATYAITVK